MGDGKNQVFRGFISAGGWPARFGRGRLSAPGLFLALGALLVDPSAGCGGSAGHGGGSPSTSSGGSSMGSTGAGGATGGSPSTSSGGSSMGSTGAGGATGGSSGAGPAAASQYVDAINAVRAALTRPANYTGTWAPLPEASWSDTVATSAHAWADHLATDSNCGLVHESQRTYGENLAMGTNLGPQEAVDMWASEQSLYTWSPTYSSADFNTGSGHYTQLVWRRSTQVGCGSATCGRVVVISCRFSPPGNYIGQAVY